MASTTKAAIKAALDETPAYHAAVPRLAPEGGANTSDVLGRPLTIVADEHGIVRPSDPDEVRLADALGWPVLRSVDQETSTPPAPTTPTTATPPATIAQLRARATELGLTVPSKAKRGAIADLVADEEARLAAAAAAEAAAESSGDADGDADTEDEET